MPNAHAQVLGTAKHLEQFIGIFQVCFPFYIWEKCQAGTLLEATLKNVSYVVLVLKLFRLSKSPGIKELSSEACIFVIATLIAPSLSD